MPLETIVGGLFSRYTKSINHLHKDINDFLSVTTILKIDAHDFIGKTMNDMGKISQFLNNPHGRCVVGAFEKKLHEVSI